MRRKPAGLTITELIIIFAITCSLLAITGIAWKKASINRKMDATIAELESGIILARQTAQNRDGAYITVCLPTDSADGYWEIVPGSLNDTNKLDPINRKEISRQLTVTFSPTSTTSLQFNSAGSINTTLSPVNSSGNCVITIGSNSDQRKVTLTVIGMTGAVVKTIEN